MEESVAAENGSTESENFAEEGEDEQEEIEDEISEFKPTVKRPSTAQSNNAKRIKQLEKRRVKAAACLCFR